MGLFGSRVKVVASPREELGDRLSGFKQEARRFKYLLLALLLLMVLSPIVQAGGGPWLRLFMTLILIAAAYVISDNESHMLIALGLAAPIFLLDWFNLSGQNIQLTGALLFFEVVYYGFAAEQIVRHVLRAPEVNMDEMYGAISAYLLVGIAWSALHALVELMVPGSYSLPAGHGWSHFLYFSFSTLATVGYGDITPLKPLAQSFSVLEAIMGVFFVAILIAHLVGMARHSLNDR